MGLSKHKPVEAWHVWLALRLAQGGTECAESLLQRHAGLVEARPTCAQAEPLFRRRLRPWRGSVFLLHLRALARASPSSARSSWRRIRLRIFSTHMPRGER